MSREDSEREVAVVLRTRYKAFQKNAMIVAMISSDTGRKNEHSPGVHEHTAAPCISAETWDGVSKRTGGGNQASWVYVLRALAWPALGRAPTYRADPSQIVGQP